MKKNAKGLYQKQITITVNGKRKQKAFYGKTIAEINRKLLAYNGEMKHGRTFDAVAEEWWYSHKETLESNSLKNYKPAYERAVNWLGDTPVRDITPYDINFAILKFVRTGVAQKTVTTQLQIIRQILTYAMLNDGVDINPATAVRVPKNLPKTTRKPPVKADIDKIKTSCEEPIALFALFLLYTGCRKGEALAIKGEDIDFEKKMISINKSVYYQSDKPFLKSPKTDAGIRIVPLLEPLEAMLPKTKKDEYLFNYKGELYRNKRFTTLWKKYCEKLNMSVTPHQLRHAYATRLYEIGIDEKSAQDLMGHADIATTRNIYTHISDEKRKTTADQLRNF